MFLDDTAATVLLLKRSNDLRPKKRVLYPFYYWKKPISAACDNNSNISKGQWISYSSNHQYLLGILSNK